MTSFIAMIAVVFLTSPPPASGWVWSYYDGDGSVVLAREIPDTDQLAALLECRPGSGAVRVTVYGISARPDFVTFTARGRSADAQRVEADGLSAHLRLDHPVFGAFASGEGLSVTAGEETITTAAPGADLMTRFRAACGE